MKTFALLISILLFVPIHCGCQIVPEHIAVLTNNHLEVVRRYVEKSKPETETIKELGKLAIEQAVFLKEWSNE